MNSSGDTPRPGNHPTSHRSWDPRRFKCDGEPSVNTAKISPAPHRQGNRQEASDPRFTWPCCAIAGDGSVEEPSNCDDRKNPNADQGSDCSSNCKPHVSTGWQSPAFQAFSATRAPGANSRPIHLNATSNEGSFRRLGRRKGAGRWRFAKNPASLQGRGSRVLCFCW